MKRFLTVLLTAVLSSLLAKAQDSTSAVTPLPDSLLFTNEFLDTVKVHGKSKINDYDLIGVNYGVTFSSAYFNPDKHNRGMVVKPGYISVNYIHHSKLFDQLPFCAFVLGLAYGNEGYTFEADEDGRSENVDGATWCSMSVVEIPAMTQIHFDFEPFKIMVNVGVYGGYRCSVERKGPNLLDFTNSFRSYERRIDYGLQGGAGFGIILSPIEIHFNCLVRWAWSSLYEPDYYSPYFYRYAYPLDIIATAGIHFQLTKRHGRTNAQLKKEAYDYVYGTH